MVVVACGTRQLSLSLQVQRAWVILRPHRVVGAVLQTKRRLKRVPIWTWFVVDFAIVQDLVNIQTLHGCT